MQINFDDLSTEELKRAAARRLVEVQTLCFKRQPLQAALADVDKKNTAVIHAALLDIDHQIGEMGQWRRELVTYLGGNPDKTAGMPSAKDIDAAAKRKAQENLERAALARANATATKDKPIGARIAQQTVDKNEALKKQKTVNKNEALKKQKASKGTVLTRAKNMLKGK